MPDIQVLYTRRIEAASIAAARGDRSEAERLYAEALTMGEERFGATSPQLAVPLNELSRLYIRDSAHALAEPLLERLLEIRRADGENHPGVATVLSALAAARRGLKDDAGAEDLYRRALAIREVAHAPDHMAVIVAVEQLADTCAAQGKLAEAKALFERALPVREKAIGAEHASVRALRERLAELAQKAAPVAAQAPAAKPAPAPAPAPVPAPAPAIASAAVAAPVPAPVAVVADDAAPNQLVFIYEPEKPVRRKSVKKDRSSMTPPFSSMALAAASIVAAPTHVAAPQAPAATQMAAPSLALTSLMDVDTPAAPRVSAVRAEREDVMPTRQRRAFSPRADVFTEAPRKSAKPYAYAAIGMTALAGALFGVNAMTSSKAHVAPVAGAEAPAAAAPSPAASVPATGVSTAALAAVARTDSTRMPITAPPAKATLVATSTPTAAPAKRGTDVADVPALPGALPTIGDVAISVGAVANADSAIRASTKQHDVSDQLPTTARLNAPTLADDRTETPPVLVGSLPQPRYPDGLRSQRIEGAVIVQFLVGADGRVDASTMKVVRSPHEQFTSAVRAVLPRFRFEPARSKDAKPRAEVVQYSFEFAATK